MSQYYVLECMGKADDLLFTQESSCDNDECWVMGRKFDTSDEDEDFHPPQEPIKLETEIDSKAAVRIYPELDWEPLPLMTRRLVAALRDAGVNNMQTYETRLTNPQGGIQEDHYLAVNIIGLVDAVKLDKSETNLNVSKALLSKDFHSLLIEPSKVHSLLLFRLAQNVSAVLVHERVKNHLEKQGITNLTWFKPESWAG